MKKTMLKKYASLIVRTGIRVQKGQEVVVYADLDQPEFVAMVVDECYRAGASKVTVEWNYQPLTKIHVRGRKLSVLGRVERWEEERLRHYTEIIPCRLYLISEDPDGLRGINLKKYAQGQQMRYKIIKPYRDLLNDKDQWCIAAVPGVAWAKKVFPELSRSRAVRKLWEVILQTSRVTEDGDPNEAWEAHNRNLLSRCDYLNSLSIKTLVYRSKNGTNLRVGMIDEAIFKGGAEKTLQGYICNPNIPSEECFITPKRGEAEGIVYATKPLSYEGQLIDGFWIRFEGGRAVEVHAEQNEELLRQMIGMDEGASYLGECALVPYDSPIRESGILFYNTLFDENAACHLAFGRGFTDTIRNAEQYSLEECHAMGVNDSMIHEDFMIGSADLDIDAETADGKTVPIFRNGNWAF